MADDDVAAERARLEAVAWGADSSPAEAARARIQLEDLRAGRRPRRVLPPEAPVPTSDDRRPRTASAGRSAVPAPTPDALGVTGAMPADDERRRVRAVPAEGDPVTGDAPFGAGAGAGAGAVRVPDPVTAAGPATGADPATLAAPAPATDPAAVPRGSGAAPEAGAPGRDGDDPGLPAGWRDRLRALLWTRRPRVWIALGAAAAVGVAFAAGTVVGTARQSVPAAPSITPTAGAVTLEQLLDVPQTYADQLPGPVDAPVSLHSTRLVFTNRALDGGDLETPWNVWAGVGTDRSTICLVATADRIESSTACYPREDALHGTVSLSAQSTSGTLTLWLRGGAVQGTVTDSY